MDQRQAATPEPARSSLGVGLWRLYRHLSKARRRQMLALLALGVIGSISEIITIGIIVPFLALLSDPALVSKYPVLVKFFSFIGWDSSTDILLPITVLFVVSAIGAGFVRIFLLWAIGRFSFGVGADLGKEVYRRILLQSYSFHATRNSSQTLASLSKVQAIVVGVINPLIQAAVSFLMLCTITAILIAVDPLVTVLTGLTFACSYTLVTLTTRKRLLKNSAIFSEMETKRIQVVQEGLGGIRDIIIDGTQNVFVRRFWSSDSQRSRALAANTFMSYSPRYAIESFGMILIALLAFWLSQRPGGVASAIPILGALALGAQRAMPQVQQIYFGWASINSAKKPLDEVLATLDLPLPERTLASDSAPLRLTKYLQLRDLCFRYADTGSDVVSHINIRIERGARVGFTGETGSGKSTLLDLIMGLLQPTSGEILIDGKPLSLQNCREWQAAISHVPQSIYLADATIAENIAFGLEPTAIDRERVREAARQARIADVIELMPDKFDTVVGERGVRLSGGQRQRIGLARALYKRADIIVLDEATSALDNETEAAVMDAIYSISRDVTVLIIAHRLTTLQFCDRIFELSNGKLSRECRFEDIVKPLSARGHLISEDQLKA